VAVTSAPRVPGARETRPVVPEVQARTTRPVKFWSLVGGLIWAVQIFILLKWVAGPYFHQVKPGPTPVPSAMKLAIVIYLAIQWALFCFLGYRWVVRPLMRERTIGIDGLLFLAWSGFFWMWDPMGNYLSPTFTYNSWIPNMGSWVNGIPGWNTPATPGAQAPEPWLFTAGAYGVFFTLMPILGCWVMRRTRERWPRIGLAGQLLIVYAMVAVLETVVEGFLWMRMGLYTYAGTPDKLWNLFPGHYYKYPIYESFSWGAVLTATTYIRWSVNDRGESIAERGIGEVRASKTAKNGLRLLAMVGCLYSMILIVYWFPYWAIWGAHDSSFPRDVQARSYLMDGICGPGTQRACPGPNVPLFRAHSVTITPSGTLSAPAGAALPLGPTTFKAAAAGH
jgi:Spirocyclase AveC-like